MGKKRIVKKRITKKKVAKKHAQSESKEKSDVSRMSRLEYEQSMMDPRFRAAMMGFNNPMGGLAQQTNQKLHEQETKNNELTRQITLQQDFANQKEKYIKLKAEKKEQKAQQDAEINKLKNDIQNQEMKRNLDRERAQYERDKESLQHQKEYDELKNNSQNEIKALKKIVEDQKREFQHQKETDDLKNELKLKQIEKDHIDKTIPLNQKINDIENELKVKSAEYKAKEDINNNANKLILTQLNQATQPILQKLDSLTNAANREIDIKQLIFDSEQRLLDKQKALDIAQFQEQYQGILNKTIESYGALQRQIEEVDTKFKAVEELKQARHKQKMLEAKAESQEEFNNIHLDIIDKQNDISLNNERYQEEAKRRKLETENKILERDVNPQTKKKYEKEIQQEKIKTAQLEKKRELVQKAAEAKKENEETKQNLLLELSNLDPKIKPEDVDTPEKFNKKMFQIQVEAQKKKTTLEHQNEFLDSVKKDNKIYADAKEKMTQQTIQFMSAHPVMERVAKKDLKMKTFEDMVVGFPEIVKSYTGLVSRHAHTLEQLPDGMLSGEHPNAEQRMYEFAKDYKEVFGEDISESREKHRAEYDNLVKEIETLRAASEQERAQKEDLQKRYNQQVYIVRDMYINTPEDIKPAFTQQYPNADLGEQQPPPPPQQDDDNIDDEIIN